MFPLDQNLPFSVTVGNIRAVRKVLFAAGSKGGMFATREEIATSQPYGCVVGGHRPPMDNVRLAFIQLALRAAGLPENLAQAKFILWLRSSGLEPKVEAALKKQNRQLFQTSDLTMTVSRNRLTA